MPQLQSRAVRYPSQPSWCRRRPRPVSSASPHSGGALSTPPNCRLRPVISVTFQPRDKSIKTMKPGKKLYRSGARDATNHNEVDTVN